MKKNVSSQSMDATLQDFLGNKPSMETPKPEPQPADTKELYFSLRETTASLKRFFCHV